MRVMTEDERRRFLTERPRTGKLATTRADGRPYVAPIWFDLDADGTIVFTTGADSLVRVTPTHVVAHADIAD